MTSLADWTPPPLPTRTAMAGRYVTLEPLAADHVPGLYEAFSEDTSNAMWHYLPTGPYADEAALAAWVEGARLQHDPVFYAIRMADGRLGGIISYLRITPVVGSIEAGWLTFAPRLQRTRAASEAVMLLVRWAFEAGYRRFEWKCDAGNAPSRAAAERFGLSYEGVFRQAAVVKGRNRDTAWFAAIDGEWPALRAAYDAWLDPSNFDEAGRQIVSLRDLTGPILVARDPAG
ncbi:GNAT family N-acetyltransferase [Pelagovum pacificum]|uniref:GNAT family N-acetyltransferase n=1 Tax=Pelagovum pacificum TaxID=2588711 RepID=A0A5C5GEA5_9RHOB|nr:GNAT family protein [Pelagovum pacificum]QQA43767.1 GNAT family N-acetyltransferase [Pelagovum pacificum]TNY33102.1 GNAT family N-acetyltransferase [Pelagovum pacificum]